jgi:hypothetical protein
LGQYALTLASTVLDQNGHPLDQDFDGTPGEGGQDSYAATFQIGSTAGVVEHFVITGLPSSVIYGTTVTDITITARDAIGQTATGFTGTVTFGGTSGATGTSANFTSGVLSGASITPTFAGNGLTFTVNDGAGHSGSTTFNVISVYDNWSGGAGFDQDANGDGVANGLAWALGAATPSANALALLPSLHFDNEFIIYTCRRADAAKDAPGTTITAEYGSALSGWTTAVHDGTDVVVTEYDNGFAPGIDRVEVKIRKTLAADGRMFLRLMASSDTAN